MRIRERLALVLFLAPIVITALLPIGLTPGGAVAVGAVLGGGAWLAITTALWIVTGRA